MGTSYVPESVQQWSRDQFNNLHATYARPITIYRTAVETVVLTNPANNYLYQQAPDNSVVNRVIQSGVVDARILYGKKQSLEQFSSAARNNSAEQNQIRLEDGEVRLKLDPTGAALLMGCERIQFDGTTFDDISSKRPHAVFGEPNFFDFYLKKLN